MDAWFIRLFKHLKHSISDWLWDVYFLPLSQSIWLTESQWFDNSVKLCMFESGLALVCKRPWWVDAISIPFLYFHEWNFNTCIVDANTKNNFTWYLVVFGTDLIIVSQGCYTFKYMLLLVCNALPFTLLFFQPETPQQSRFKHYAVFSLKLQLRFF